MTDSAGLEFKSFAKLNRFHDETMFITEKIDGTNAQIFIYETGKRVDEDGSTIVERGMKIGSRNRYITPDDDNFGFARWCMENYSDLIKLPMGRHYGEWWGNGIQRGYNQETKRFSLFNQSLLDIKAIVPCIDFVPLLSQHQFDLQKVEEVMDALKTNGSSASPGFMDVEGTVIYLKKAGIFFKYTYDNRHKWQQVGEAA